MMHECATNALDRVQAIAEDSIKSNAHWYSSERLLCCRMEISQMPSKHSELMFAGDCMSEEGSAMRDTLRLKINVILVSDSRGRRIYTLVKRCRCTDAGCVRS